MTPHDRWLEPDEEPERPVKDCEYCDGHGITPATYSDPLGDQCQYCGGTGQIEITDAELAQKQFDDFDPPDNDFGEPL